MVKSEKTMAGFFERRFLLSCLFPVLFYFL